MPNRKVWSGGLGGAVALIVIALINYLTGVQINAELSAAITTVVIFLVGYYVPEPKPIEPAKPENPTPEG